MAYAQTLTSSPRRIPKRYRLSGLSPLTA